MADYVIVVAGNICAGKSDLVNYISDNTNFKKELEFIDHEAGKLFYLDRKAHSRIFESSNRINRIVRHMKAKNDSGTYVFDRGLIEGAETFCRNSFEEGYLSHRDYQRYIDDVKEALDDLDRTQQDRWLERLIVRLQVKDVTILQQRQRNRNTNYEHIPEGYLKRINELYDRFFDNLDEIYSGYGVETPRVMSVDASVDFTLDNGYHSGVLRRIKGEIEKDVLGE